MEGNEINKERGCNLASPKFLHSVDIFNYSELVLYVLGLKHQRAESNR